MNEIVYKMKVMVNSPNINLGKKFQIINELTLSLKKRTKRTSIKNATGALEGQV